MSRRSIHCPATTSLVLALALGAILHGARESQAGQPQREVNGEIYVVPAPKGVVIDADLSDWDLSGTVEMYMAEASRKTFACHGTMMYDAKYLYVAAHVLDSSPMKNVNKPRVGAGFAADSVQVRLCTDPDHPWPVGGGHNWAKPLGKVDTINHLMWWWYSGDEPQAAFDLAKGMDFHWHKVYDPGEEGLEVAYKEDADGKGYVMESRTPWALLTAGKPAPKGGDILPCCWFINYANDEGSRLMFFVSDIANPNHYIHFWTHGDSNGWGRAVLTKTGNLKRPKKASEEELRPLRWPLKLDETRHVSLALYGTDGVLVRNVLQGHKFEAGERQVPWDGLGDNRKPLGPGTYTYRVLTHTGVTTEFVTSVHNAGQPPGPTGDGSGSWGADHAWPRTVFTDGEAMFLCWGYAEAGAPIIKTDLEGKKQWGGRGGGSITCAEGKYLYGIVRNAVKRHEKHHAVPTPWESGQNHLFPPDKEVSLRDLDTHEGRLAVIAEILKPLPPKKDKKDRPVRPPSTEGYVAVYDLKTEKLLWKVKTAPVHDGAFGPEGGLYVTDGKKVLLVSEGKEPVVAVSEELKGARGLDIDAAGRFYVADPKDVQVKVFSPQGRLLRAIGKKGGRKPGGPYDPKGMVNPGGVCVDPLGRLWVAEVEERPKRYSVWDTQTGKLYKEFFGASAYSTHGSADEADPEIVYCHGCEWEIDYKKKSWRLKNVLGCRHKDGSIRHWGGHYARYHYRHFRRGPFRTFDYLVPGNNPGTGSSMVRLKDSMVRGVWTCNGRSLKQSYPGKLEKGKYLVSWSDLNGDGKRQSEEFLIANKRMSYGTPYIHYDLTLYWRSGKNVYKLPLKEVNKHGAPIWPLPSEATAVIEGDGGGIIVDEGGYIYLHRGGGYWNRIAVYTPEGKLIGRYYHSLNNGIADAGAPIGQPGLMIAAHRFNGAVDRYVGLTSYYGDYYLMDRDCLFVSSLAHDQRTGPEYGPRTMWCENFNGHLFRNKRNGKIYLVCGDTDCRILEVKGLETIERSKGTITFTEKDAQLAAEFKGKRMAAQTAGVTVLPVIRQKTKISPNGNFSEWWGLAQGVKIVADETRHLAATLAYDKENLYLAYRVHDPNPWKNQGKEWDRLYTTGDAVDVWLGTDPKADPARKKPVKGDIRVVIAQFKGKPVAVLYEQVNPEGQKNPTLYESPTNKVMIDRVEILKDAKIGMRVAPDSYQIEAAIPLKTLGLSPEAEMKIKADVGIIFSDRAGMRSAHRMFWSNKAWSMVNDVPTETRLWVSEWGTAEFK